MIQHLLYTLVFVIMACWVIHVSVAAHNAQEKWQGLFITVSIGAMIVYTGWMITR